MAAAVSLTRAAALSVADLLHRARLELAPRFGAIVCSCGCGATYEAEAFSALPWVGWQDDFEGGWLELRNCTGRNARLGRECRSTIARRK